MALFLVNNATGSVWSFSPIGGRQWQFARLAECQKAKQKYVLRYKNSGPAKGWALLDQSPDCAGEVIGVPVGGGEEKLQDARQPPVGAWQLQGVPHTLRTLPPEGPPSLGPLEVEAPFGRLTLREEGAAARLEVALPRTAVADEALEEGLQRLRQILENLAARPNMILLLLLDARRAPMPSVQQIRRLRAFMREMATEFLLVGRGCATVVQTSGHRWSMTRAAVTLAQSWVPAHFPRTTCATKEEAEAFLSHLLVVESGGGKGGQRAWQLPPKPAAHHLTKQTEPAALPSPSPAKREKAMAEEQQQQQQQQQQQAPVCPGFWQEAAAAGRRGGLELPRLWDAIAARPPLPPFSPVSKNAGAVPSNMLKLDLLEGKGGHGVAKEEQGMLWAAVQKGGCGSPVMKDRRSLDQRKDAQMLDIWRRRLDAQVRPPQEASPTASNYSGISYEAVDYDLVNMAPGGLGLFCGCQCVKVESSSHLVE